MIEGLHPYWLWRVGLVAIGMATYCASMMLVGRKLQKFARADADSRRIRRISRTPYFTDGILAGFAGILNPAGLFYVIAPALPSTLGVNAGLLSLPSMLRRWRQPAEPIETIRRSRPGSLWPPSLFYCLSSSSAAASPGAANFPSVGTPKTLPIVGTTPQKEPERSVPFPFCGNARPAPSCAFLVQRHIVSTTRNSAFPLIIRAYASAAFSRG